MEIINDHRLISMAADYHDDGYSQEEIAALLVKDGFSDLEAKLALEVLFPFGLEPDASDNIIKCFKTKKGQHLWCPKYRAVIQHGTCEQIKCAHLLGCGENHINCNYRAKDE